ncbi:MAG TPA: hypothetical protein VEL74_04845 [Thermoanaerobaculia bacterium]|nr:hypothetical protein [Thermoanaerobaculia bacterium]
MTDISVAAVLADLEAQMAHHRKQMELHAEQEAAHGRQREHHAAELAKLSQHYEDFKRTAGAVLEVASPRTLRSQGGDPGVPSKLSRMVDAVLAGKAADEPFSASQIAAEVRERFGARLRRPIDPRSISAKLRRMEAAGKIHQLREGRSYHEALYCRERPRTERDHLS